MKALRFGFYQEKGWNGRPAYLAALRVGPQLELQMFSLKGNEWRETGSRFSYSIGEPRTRLMESGDPKSLREIVRGALEAEIMMGTHPHPGGINLAHDIAVQGEFIPQMTENLELFKPLTRAVLTNGEVAANVSL